MTLDLSETDRTGRLWPTTSSIASNQSDSSTSSTTGYRRIRSIRCSNGYAILAASCIHISNLIAHIPQSKKLFDQPIEVKQLAPHPESGAHHRGSAWLVGCQLLSTDEWHQDTPRLDERKSKSAPTRAMTRRQAALRCSAISRRALSPEERATSASPTYGTPKAFCLVSRRVVLISTRCAPIGNVYVI